MIILLGKDGDTKTRKCPWARIYFIQITHYCKFTQKKVDQKKNSKDRGKKISSRH